MNVYKTLWEKFKALYKHQAVKSFWSGLLIMYNYALFNRLENLRHGNIIPVNRWLGNLAQALNIRQKGVRGKISIGIDSALVLYQEITVRQNSQSCWLPCPSYSSCSPGTGKWVEGWSSLWKIMPSPTYGKVHEP